MSERLDIVCFCHLHWDRALFQRPQQIMSRLAQRHRVLYVKQVAFKTILRSRSFIRSWHDESGVEVIEVAMPPSVVERVPGGRRLCEAWLRRWVRATMKSRGMARPVLWNYHPDYAHTVGKMDERIAVYDCMDDHTAFMDGRHQVAENDRRLLAASSLVYAGGLKMREDRLPYQPEIHFFPCGVETAHFRQAFEAHPRMRQLEREGMAANVTLPDDVADLTPPVLGYWGAVDRRIDWEVLEAVAERRRTWTILLLGPVVKMPEAELRDITERHANIRWLGSRPYASLPAYARSFDVCIMPWVEGGDAESINPTKTLEYLATGRPVVSTRISDVVAQYGPPEVELATGSGAFIAAVERALSNDEPLLRESRLALTDGKTWDEMVDGMEALLVARL